MELQCETLFFYFKGLCATITSPETIAHKSNKIETSSGLAILHSTTAEIASHLWTDLCMKSEHICERVGGFGNVRCIAPLSLSCIISCHLFTVTL